MLNLVSVLFISILAVEIPYLLQEGFLPKVLGNFTRGEVQLNEHQKSQKDWKLWGDQ